jgi:hypothetical protein
MEKAYLETSVMSTEISRCLIYGSAGCDLRETEGLRSDLKIDFTKEVTKRKKGVS